MARKKHRRSRHARCKYGKLKHPRGRRICRVRPSRRRRPLTSSRREAIKYERDLEREMIARHKASLGRLRRRRR
jgi:hypothetical protein